MIRCDAVVVGGGVMGAATAWELARRGHEVVLLDRFWAGHERGSSHGTERIFRLVYPEPDYARLAAAALPLWRELEEAAGEVLLETTGALDLGPDEALAPLAAACEAAGVPVSWLDPDEVAERWPGLRPDLAALHQADGGRTFADRALAALLRLTGHVGGTVHHDEPVERIVPERGGVEVRTAAGAYRAPVAVVTAAGWTPGLLQGIAALPPITCTREHVVAFDPVDPAAAWPSFIWHGTPERYGLAMPDGRVKLGEHGTGPAVDPDDAPPGLDPVVLERVTAWVAEHIPGVHPTPVLAATCLYAATPTDDFVLDRIGNVVVGAGFGGHGFKFAPLVGRILADLALGHAGPGGRFALR